MNNLTFMQGKPFEGTEEETLETIRAILTEELKAEPAPRKAASAKAFVDRTVSAAKAPRRRSTDFPALEAQAAPAPKPSKFRALARAIGKIPAFRPTTRHLAIVSLLLLIVVRPHWFVIGGLVSLFVVGGLFLTLGAQRIWGGVLRYVQRVERKDAARAARLRAGLDRFACRWDGILDWLPDGLADDLYMPDFQDLQRDKDAELDRVVTDRLNRMV
ncbi:hypothetical protein [Tateyamaria sp. SN6-1]|uniref:hypothetical protein n=1 Tax=Tateyamaria sp. SN6-1 TaxID=3092148 RepID=UPI0039F5797B